jgi:hypothetical protein
MFVWKQVATNGFSSHFSNEHGSEIHNFQTKANIMFSVIDIWIDR